MVLFDAVKMRRVTKRPYWKTIDLPSPDPSIYDPSIPSATRKQVMKLVVDYALFSHPDEWMRRSVAFKLYHTCRAFRHWSVVHRLLCHTIPDHLSEGMRECKCWDYQDLFPGVPLTNQHWWWTNRISAFNEVLDLCFDVELYHPGSWKEEPITEVAGSPFRFANVNHVILKHAHDKGVENILFWEAADASSMILYAYTLLKNTSWQDFVVMHTVRRGHKAIFRYSGGSLDYWYRDDSEFLFEEFLDLLMEDNPKAMAIMRESWSQTSLTPVERFERFVDRWFTRTPQLPILSQE